MKNIPNSKYEKKKLGKLKATRLKIKKKNIFLCFINTTMNKDHDKFIAEFNLFY